MDIYETSKSTFEALAATTTAFNENEATTRHRLIDVVLTDCLGWDRDDIASEKVLSGDHFDYDLGRPDGRVILEAKRSSKNFEAPAGGKAGLILLSTI